MRQPPPLSTALPLPFDEDHEGPRDPCPDARPLLEPRERPPRAALPSARQLSHRPAARSAPAAARCPSAAAPQATTPTYRADRPAHASPPLRAFRKVPAAVRRC